MKGRVLLPWGVKVGYVSQGLCVTEVKYSGYYCGYNGAFGGFGKVIRAIWTLGTKDYARTFHYLRYNIVRHVTLPNEFEIPPDAAANTFFMEDVELTGPGPWCAGYPGMNIRECTMGQAWRALVIQSYMVTAGDKAWDKPVISLFVRKNHGGDAPNVDTLVRPPVGVTVMGSWYEPEIDLYWVTLPHNAVDYYGPNEALRTHLEEKPDSWKIVFREAKGNNLKVEVTGGEVKETYPIIVQASTGAPEVRVDSTGGVGAVPIRFEGLDGGSYQLYKVLSKEADGQCDSTPAESSRQINYDAETFTYSVTYNIVLDRLHCSLWVLKK